MKRGRLSDAEKQLIQANVGRQTPEEIAERLHRSEDVVKKYIKSERITTPVSASEEKTEKILIRQDLLNSEAWKQLKLEFRSEELKYFEEAYIKLMAQFKGNVLASEETQIFQVIKFEILMSRNLKARNKALSDISRLERMEEDFFTQFNGDPSQMDQFQKGFALNLETQLQAAKTAEQSRTSEYTKLQQRHDSLMRGLRAVRDQRVKQIEEGNKDFLGVIKFLQDRDNQDAEGKQMELTKLAAQKEYVRLGRPHTYEDKNEDNPILSADTVNLEKEVEDEK